MTKLQSNFSEPQSNSAFLGALTIRRRAGGGSGQKGSWVETACQVANWTSILKCNNCDFALSHAANLRKHMDGKDMDQMANNNATILQPGALISGRSYFEAGLACPLQHKHTHWPPNGLTGFLHWLGLTWASCWWISCPLTGLLCSFAF